MWNKTHSQSAGSMGRPWQTGSWIWLSVFLAAAGWFVWGALGGHQPEHMVAAIPVGVSASASSAEVARKADYATRPIEQIQVGQRVITELSDDLRDEAYGSEEQLPYWDREEVDPATWRRVALAMQLTAEDRLDILLLRPLRWLNENDCRPGNEIHLAMPELNVDGAAVVISVADCPPIQVSAGTIVTGTFTHVRGGIVSLSFAGLPQPIVATDNHRFFSETKGDFVAAGRLQVGDEVQTLKGTCKLVALQPLDGEARVFNLEVLHEHVFRVSTLGLLVHNTYPTESPIPRSYIDLEHTINMREAPPGSDLNAAGEPRNGRWFWDRMLERFPEMFSEDNRIRIRDDRSAPYVDQTWIDHNPTHQSFMHDKLIHHHIDQGNIASGLPQSIHWMWTGLLHPIR